MAKARADGKPIVYIGFGSITVPDPTLVTERIIRGVLKSEYWPSFATTLRLTAVCAQVECARLSPKVGRRGCQRVRMRAMLSSPKNAILCV